ncbi:MAG: tetratricopeptide repeat protein [Taibaiella sp.]|nr:tetratricopeptide repeat protein [Taibaiella sp.]
MRLIFTAPLLLLLFLYSRYPGAQTIPKKLDSLKSKLTSAAADTNKVLLLCEISLNYYQADPEEGIVYGRKALALAKKLRYDYGIIKSHNVIARCYAIRNNYPEALLHFKSALAGAERMKSPRMIAILSVSLGAVYSDKGEYEKALDYLMKAKRSYEEAGIDNTLSLYNNIGYLHFKQKKYREALKWYLAGIESGKRIDGATDEKIRLYSNAGSTYIGVDNYDSALIYLYTALEKQEKSGDLRGSAVTSNAIADAYLAIVINAPANLSDSLHENKKNLEKAYRRMQQSMTLSRELGLKDLVLEVYSNYVDYYELQKNYIDAYKYYHRYILLRDSLRDINEEKRFAKIEAEFLFTHKTDSLKYLNSIKDRKLEQRRTERNGLVVLAAMIAGMSLLFVNRQKLKRKMAEQTAKNIRERAQQHIDSLARSISEKNELIERVSAELEKRVKTGEVAGSEYDLLHEMKQAILLTDQQWETFKNDFEKIHKGYITRLREKIPDITPAETRFFVLSKLRLSNKEMAGMLGISTQAIRVMKHRIMKKLGIEEDAALDELIQTI